MVRIHRGHVKVLLRQMLGSGNVKAGSVSTPIANQAVNTAVKFLKVAERAFSNR
jgi:hypothetical protein